MNLKAFSHPSFHSLGFTKEVVFNGLTLALFVALLKLHYFFGFHPDIYIFTIEHTCEGPFVYDVTQGGQKGEATTGLFGSFC